MEYTSTRDNSLSVSAAHAIKTGLAPDGGLFVPKSFPRIFGEELSELAQLSYAERATKILEKFLTDFSVEELSECTRSAYNKDKFETDEIAPLYQMTDDVYFLELWHGPTCAFKDMALQILPHFLKKSVAKTGETKEVVILVATSGDTGKAALEGFKDVNGTRIIVFYPENGVSDVQKRQMVTQEGNNVDVAAVIGNFDDAQSGVKKIFGDKEYAQVLERNNFMLSSANSINWGRLVPQIVYYFSAYCNLLKYDKIKLGDPVNFVVPTGNFGNILAAYYAKEMGLPIGKLICASNENNVLTDFIRTGVYDKNRPFKTTGSPSMDILISSNLERLLYHATGRDDVQVAAWMKELSETGRYEVSDSVKAKIQELFYGGYCDDAATEKTILETNVEHGYVMDTHTAVAKCVYDAYRKETSDETKSVIVSTASPFKFSNRVLGAVAGQEALAGLDEFAMLEALAEKTDLTIPAPLAGLKSKAVIFNATCEKTEMYEVVSHMLNLL